MTSQVFFQYLNVQMLQVLLNETTTLNPTNGTSNSTVIDSNLDQEGLLAMVYPVISSLYFNVIFMGLCASLISFTITLIIERAGSRVGGVISSIPTAVVPSTLGFALDALFKFGQDSTTRQHVMTRGFFTIPIGTFMTAIFLLCWKVLPPHIDQLVVKRWRRFISSKIEQLKSKAKTSNSKIEDLDVNSSQPSTTIEVVNKNNDQEGEKLKESTEVPPTPTASSTNEEESLQQEDLTNVIILSEKDESPNESSPTTVIQIENSNSADDEPTFQIKALQALGSDTLIKVMSGLLVCLLGVSIWTVMASTYMTAISLIQWRDEIHIAISVLCFVATLVLAVKVSWTYKVYKPLNQSSNTNSNTPTSPEKKKFKKSRLIIFALRIGLPFCLVSISVLLNAMQLTLLAGLFASFPTIYMTTLFTLWIGNEDETLAVESVGPMMLGSCSVSLYSMIACPTMFSWNLLAGAFVAYGCAVVGINIPAFFYLRWRKIVGEKSMNKAQFLIEEGNSETKLQALKLQDSMSSPVQNYTEYTHDDMELSATDFPSNKLSFGSSIGSKSVDSISSLESAETCSMERSHSSESLHSVISDIEV
ncbi:hypothetical protein NAEGRDRAFT_80387 [Naegleria gruberi]|uniref:Uncharacterized protein n=1 Tax=Naegleria gruberi TaxID=5762 RepID=D2VKY8_NAEGR|nr:uncharacterized protein NAEGRDRAFT_80387 [Naegleria gruberi]EFC42526.1 hypothetical protein NAEGRDRAFT_80387 [Naegleria gruberi]|eukprot:XP_002675270.1 hypothetical protein NAEGRDRAFT_80387 [Naegleria gruberi strain NEG-M]